jgi:hypothetical protein
MGQSLIKLRSPCDLVCVVSIVSLCFCACAHPAKRPGSKISAPVFVGEIAMINQGTGFVLVDISSASSPPPPASELTTRNADGVETSRLKVTPENKRPFIAADIVSGSPKRGDRVYQ